MLNAMDKIEDNLGDEISPILAAVNATRRWTKKKHQLIAELEKLLVSKRYKKFNGDCRYYHLTCKGQASLYDVPGNQQGVLRPYRNKRVRLVCMGSSDAYTGRWYFVAVVHRK